MFTIQNSAPHFAVLGALILLGGCGPDETISGYAARDATFALQEFNGEPVAARVTIQFPDEGQIAGDGPCNSYSAIQSAPYPWFDSGPVRATKRACPELETEARFFDLLPRITFAEVQGPTLILSNSDGEVLVFQSD